MASGELIGLLRSAGLSGPAARQRVSRHPRIRTLKGIRLPHNESFVYLEEQFKRPTFWSGLIATLKAKHSGYGACLAALEMYGGQIPEKRFGSISGSPTRLKGQLSAETLFNRLSELGLLAQSGGAEVPTIVEFGRNVPELLVDSHALRARALAEEIMLAALRDWLRNNGLASFEKVQLRNSAVDKMPEYGHFNWDLTGPSYMHPLAVRSKGAIRPGFVVADVALGFEVTDDGITAFMKKVASVRSQKVPQALAIFVADRFSPEAWRLGREKGVWFTTPGHILGREVAAGLEALINVLSNAAAAATSNWSRVEEMLKKLGRIEGAAMNIRGALFEMVVGGAIQASGLGNIDIREPIIDRDGRKTDIDVLAVLGKSGVVAYECKGKEPGGRVTLQDVDKWIFDQIPVIMSWLKDQERFNSARKGVSFWTSGVFDPDARTRLEEERVKTKAYDIDFKEGSEISDFVRATKDRGRIAVYDEHFRAHPLATSP